MKKYKVLAESLLGEATRREYAVEAENEESAKKKALDKMIAEETNDDLLESPNQIFTVEEMGYFYDHKLEPKNIIDPIDQMEAYIEEMRQMEDLETIPKALRQYAWEYFRDVEVDKEKLKQLALYVADKTYRIIANITIVDNYTRAFFAKFIPFLWDTFQNRGIDIFYIVDNTFDNDGKFEVIVQLMELTGMAVVKPYGADGNLDYSEVEKQLRAFMKPVRMIMYIEKDSSVNYIENVLKIPKSPQYLCIFRNKASTDPRIEIIN